MEDIIKEIELLNIKLEELRDKLDESIAISEKTLEKVKQLLAN